MSDEQTYVVDCRICGSVKFDLRDDVPFQNPIAAAWYAGYHSATEHPIEAKEYQVALPTTEDDAA